jgi:hypothetical protein
MMPNTTKLFMYKNAVDAQGAFALHKGQDGNNVILIGPSDKIRTVGDAPTKIEWDSGDAVDWYALVVSRDPVWINGDSITEMP